jgi:YidC/Oxa1 family membrane protein insertase
MQIIGDLFNLILLQPTINLIVAILRLLVSVHIPGALGISIIILTVLIKVVLWPLTHSQLKATKTNTEKMALIKGEKEALKKKHQSDKLALRQAEAELYRKHGINPTSGCLPILIQTAFIWPIYQVVQALLDPVHGLDKINYFLYFSGWKLNKLPDPHFLGVNLAGKPADFAHLGFLVLLVPLLTAVFSLVQAKMISPAPQKPYPSDSPKEKKEKESTEDTMSAVQGQMSFLMPLMFAYFSFTFPIGLSIYWNTLTILTIFQQYKANGWGQAKDLFKYIPFLSQKK